MNKNIILALVIVLIVAAGYFIFSQKPETPSNSENLKETSVRETVAGFLEAKQNRNFEDAKQFLSSDFAETIDSIEFSETSNPHAGRFEMQDIKEISDEKIKVEARVYQEYTGEGEIGYNDNSYYLEIFDGRYLIASIDYGEFIDITPANQGEDAENYKLYRNDEFGFEIKYPKDWLLEKGENGVNFKRATKEMEGEFLLALSISIENTSEESVLDWFNKEFPDREQGLKPNEQSIMVGGKEGIKYFDPISMGGCGETFAVIKRGKIFKLLRDSSTCDYSDELFVDIISSFEFVE